MDIVPTGYREEPAGSDLRDVHMQCDQTGTNILPTSSNAFVTVLIFPSSQLLSFLGEEVGFVSSCPRTVSLPGPRLRHSTLVALTC